MFSDISVKIGYHCYHGLCDMGASASAIPYDLYKEIMHDVAPVELEDIDGEPMPWKTDDKPTSSTIPTSITSEEIITWVWALLLETAKLGEVPRYHITIRLLSLPLYLVQSF